MRVKISSLPIHALALYDLADELDELTIQETQSLYWFGPPLRCNTLLQCLVWWIASWADDEQYKGEQPREGLFLTGAMNC